MPVTSSPTQNSRENTGKEKLHSQVSADLSPKNLFQAFFIPDDLLASLLAPHSFCFHFCSNLIFRLEIFMLFLDTSLVSLHSTYRFLFVTKPSYATSRYLSPQFFPSSARIFYLRTTCLGNYSNLFTSDTLVRSRKVSIAYINSFQCWPKNHVGNL